MERLTNRNSFLTPDELTSLQLFFEKRVSWTYGWQSDTEGTPFSHWNHDFLKADRGNQEDQQSLLAADPDLAVLRELWARLKREILPGHSLVRCYANAHTYGVEGYPHVDARVANNYTTIVYVNPIWKPEWAGETVFFDDLGDIFSSILPKPGRVITFDGRILHAARALSRNCPALRVTLMFKSKAPDSNHDSR